MKKKRLSETEGDPGRHCCYYLVSKPESVFKHENLSQELFKLTNLGSHNSAFRTECVLSIISLAFQF